MISKKKDAQQKKQAASERVKVWKEREERWKADKAHQEQDEKDKAEKLSQDEKDKEKQKHEEDQKKEDEAAKAKEKWPWQPRQKRAFEYRAPPSVAAASVAADLVPPASVAVMPVATGNKYQDEQDWANWHSKIAKDYKQCRTCTLFAF
jgi:hypothetical protein